MSSKSNSSPILRSRALWGRLLKGSRLVRMQGEDVHKKPVTRFGERPSR